MIPVRAYLQLLTSYLRELGGRVVVLAVMLFVGIALQLLNPQLIKRFIDGAISGRGAEDLVGLAVLFIVVAVVQQVMAVSSTWLAEDVGWRATNRLRRDLTEHVVNLDMGYHKAHSAGELIERVDGDVTALSNFFSAMILKVVGNGTLLVGIVVMVFFESWLVGLITAAMLVVGVVSMGRIHARAVPRWQAIRASSAEAMGWVGEQIEGTEDVTANGATAFMQTRFADMLRRWLPRQVRGWMGWAWLWGASTVVHGVAIAAVFVVGAWLFGVGSMTVGAIYLVFHYIEMTRHPMEQIREQMEDLQKAGAAIVRVEELFQTGNRLRPAGTTRLPSGPLGVAFQAVTFGYRDDDHDTTAVLHDVTFEVGAGRIVGILGRTGSGKSTIARLVTRLYEPQVGAVTLDGVPTWDLHPTDLRRSVAMVTQDVQLFRATVRDNLTFFDPTISDEQLLEVIQRLELGPWLASLPAGLDTMLGADSGGLSAGQAQLLAFTRVFLTDPAVVVLDEASSRLDPATEAMIERAVDHLMEGRTGLIIAHRLHTVARADDILVLEDGRVVEYGDRQTLVADDTSRLARLLRTGMEEVLT